MTEGNIFLKSWCITSLELRAAIIPYFGMLTDINFVNIYS